MSDLLRTRRVQVVGFLALAAAMLLFLGALALIPGLEDDQTAAPSQLEQIEAAILGGEARALGDARTQVDGVIRCDPLGRTRGGEQIYLCAVATSGGPAPRLICAAWIDGRLETEDEETAGSACLRDGQGVESG